MTRNEIALVCMPFCVGLAEQALKLGHVSADDFVSIPCKIAFEYADEFLKWSTGEKK